MKLIEINGNLFNDNNSLAHCVSKDLAMSKGIATTFKEKFGNVDKLLSQNKNVGECAYLEMDDRMIFYLVTKERYYHKPTYDDLFKSLNQMKQLCIDNDIKKLSMPKIGCGLDGLQWNEVKEIIQDVLKEIDITINIYYL